VQKFIIADKSVARIENDFSSRCYQLMIRVGDNSFMKLGKTKVEEIHEAAVVGDDYKLPITHELCQSLIDELYLAGFRPSDDRYSHPVIKAKSEHLEDTIKQRDQLMQKLLGMQWDLTEMDLKDI